jgi:hypothetical protein
VSPINPCIPMDWLSLNGNATQFGLMRCPIFTDSGPILARGLRVYRNPANNLFLHKSDRHARMNFVAEVDMQLGRPEGFDKLYMINQLSGPCKRALKQTSMLFIDNFSSDARVLFRSRDASRIILCQEEFFELALWAQSSLETQVDLYKKMEALCANLSPWANDAQGNYLCAKLDRSGLALEFEALCAYSGSFSRWMDRLKPPSSGAIRYTVQPWPLSWKDSHSGGLARIVCWADNGVGLKDLQEGFAGILQSVIDYMYESVDTADDHGRALGVLVWASSLAPDEAYALLASAFSGKALLHKFAKSKSTSFARHIGVYLSFLIGLVLALELDSQDVFNDLRTQGIL